jgi:hypothetical protein
MAQMIQNMQVKIKKTSQSFFVLVFRFFSGIILGLTLGIAGQEAFNYGQLAFWFVTILFLTVFLKISQKWGVGHLIVYNLICVLLGLLLRMYVLVAPGN